MSTHNSDILTPSAIVADEGIYFKVPLYQRLFAWSEPEVLGLLEDLRYHFNKLDKEDSSDTPYYLGVVTTVRDGGKLCLVDGQQRLTVLMIMASKFARYSENWSSFFDSGKRLELFARKDDELYMRSLADTSIKTAYVNKLMEAASHAIEQFIANMSEDERVQYINNCFNHITLFNSTLPNEYLDNPPSLNKYFEVMNSSGVNLEQHEVLKVLLLKGQVDQQHLLKIWNLCADFSKPLCKKNEDTDSLQYATFYSDLFCIARRNATEALRRLEDTSNQNGCYNDNGNYPTIAEIPVRAHNFDSVFTDERERSVVSFPEFLLALLDLYLQQNGRNDHRQNLWAFYKTECLIERFSDYLPHESVSEFYDFMLTMRIALDAYVIRRNTDGLDSSYSLVCREGNMRQGHICLKQYEAMLAVSTPYYKWVPNLLNHIHTLEKCPTTCNLLSFLKTWDNSQHALPSDYVELAYGSVDRYWFWRLDYYLWENVAFPSKEHDEDCNSNHYSLSLIEEYKQAVLNYTFRANRSIEHLHPQNQSHNEIWSMESVNSFGNLAMISQSFNSLQSNDDVHVKFARIETQARNKNIQSIKMLYMYLKAKGNPNEWSPLVSEEHAKEMTRILEMSFL